MHQTLSSRQTSSGNADNLIFIVISVVVVFLFVSALISYIALRRFRLQNREPKYIPTSFLKQKWHSWSPRDTYGRINANERGYGRSRNLSTLDTSYNPASGDVEDSAAAAAAAAGVDRNTSVRSVMTLPVYSQAPKESEQVLGREGERGGMDTVVEFPENSEEEERHRDEEMESLYQIRQARRHELAEREARRQERREARTRGDRARLEELRMEARARADAESLGATAANGSSSNLSATAMLAEHQARPKDRRVSSVSYASVGHVRHDGTRLRANSDDSERGGLLDEAAPMGEGQDHNRAPSADSSFYPTLPQPHFRDRSASSALSISTTASDRDAARAGQPTPPLTQDGGRNGHAARSSRDSDLVGTGTSDSSPTASRFTPENSTGSEDVGEPHGATATGGLNSAGSEPPNYEHLEWGEAPAYESPVHDRAHTAQINFNDQGAQRPEVQRIRSIAPRLPTIEILPSISVEGATEPNTPASPTRRDISSTQPSVTSDT